MPDTTPVLTDADLARERPFLLGLAYRLLGSASDAEDVVQEALLRASARRDLRSLRAFLTTVVTRLCLDELRSARRRREAYVGPWLPEPVLTRELLAPTADVLDHREDVSMAFLIVLEELSPMERAAFVLREVFDLDFADIAAALRRSESACRKLLQRARERIAAREVPERIEPGAQLEVVHAFFAALATGDLQGLVSALAEEATLIADHGGKVRAIRNTLRGPQRIARYFAGLTRRAMREGVYESMPAFVNGMPALIIRGPDARIESVMLFSVEGASRVRIASVRAVRNPEKLRAIERGISLAGQLR